METVTGFIFLGSKSLWMVSEATKFKDTCSLEEKLWQRIKSRDITLPTKVCLVKALVFPVVMYGCESWTIKKAEHWRIDAFWTVVLEKTLESPLDRKEIKPVNPKGNQSWIFIGRTDAEAEALMLWPPDGRNLLTGKDPNAGKDWGQEEKGETEDEIVGWHHYSMDMSLSKLWESWPWTGRPGMLQSVSRKKLDTIERLNWTELMTLNWEHENDNSINNLS